MQSTWVLLLALPQDPLAWEAPGRDQEALRRAFPALRQAMPPAGPAHGLSESTRGRCKLLCVGAPVRLPFNDRSASSGPRPASHFLHWPSSPFSSSIFSLTFCFRTLLRCLGGLSSLEACSSSTSGRIRLMCHRWSACNRRRPYPPPLVGCFGNQHACECRVFVQQIHEYAVPLPEAS